jgi:hypothetical protein
MAAQFDRHKRLRLARRPGVYQARDHFLPVPVSPVRARASTSDPRDLFEHAADTRWPSGDGVRRGRLGFRGEEIRRASEQRWRHKITKVPVVVATRRDRARRRRRWRSDSAERVLARQWRATTFRTPRRSCEVTASAGVTAFLTAGTH